MARVAGVRSAGSNAGSLQILVTAWRWSSRMVISDVRCRASSWSAFARTSTRCCIDPPARTRAGGAGLAGPDTAVPADSAVSVSPYAALADPAAMSKTPTIDATRSHIDFLAHQLIPVLHPIAAASKPRSSRAAGLQTRPPQVTRGNSRRPDAL